MDQLFKMEEEEVLLTKLSKRQIVDFFDIPEEHRLTPSIVRLERKLGLRRTLQSGYDVIRNNFFVEEIVLCKNFSGDIIEETIVNLFFNFDEFYKFLEGQIYDNSCYFLYNFSPLEIEKYSIDLKKINKKAFITDNVSNYSLNFSKDELYIYEEKEKEKKIREQWIKKLVDCKNYKEFKKVTNNLQQTEFDRDFMFFIFCFIFSANKFVFEILNQYIKENDCTTIERLLCLFYNPDDVLSSYSCCNRAPSTNKKHKSCLKAFVRLVKENKYKIIYQRYFDENSHFFCEKQLFYFNGSYFPFEVYRYFNSFSCFVSYLHNDLTSCNLSKAILPNIDFSLYKTDETTNLPIEYQKEIEYIIIKEYDRLLDVFNVAQYWVTQNKRILKKYKHSFKYFSDFAYFLNYDLSNSNLLFCEGIKNIDDYSIFSLKEAILRSEIWERLGIKYKKYKLNTKMQGKENSLVIKNEEASTEILEFQREKNFDGLHFKTIYYISDIHLLHRLENFDCKSEVDYLYALQKIIDNLLKDVGHWNNVLLIAGDTSSDFEVFSVFIKLLRKTLDVQGFRLTVIFTLGNHELWSFKDDSFEDIVKKYDELLRENKMYLLQNEIIYIEDDNKVKKITTIELQTSSNQKIRRQLIKAGLILFGGLGFSGNNQSFNANDGIYKTVIHREKEIQESQLFDNLYKKICSALLDKNIIVLTHMPKKDWSRNDKLQAGFIYVNGHNHKNYYYTDGMTSIYADNQIGYLTKNFYSKCFCLSDDYDIFSEYKNGIYRITPQEYKEFYYGKRLRLNFTRDINILYMLKKNGYYCFIHQAKDGKLTLFNGGALKRLKKKDINYYYENMDRVISYIKSPLTKLMEIQKKISNEIKKIGGDGFIHGAIIDIDCFCHVYVNPLDLKITYYWASDIIEKICYKEFGKLLKEHNKQLYTNYCNLLNGKNDLIIQRTKGQLTNQKTLYLETDIYRSSNEIKKMQKLNENILTVWYEKSSEFLLEEQ